MTQLYLPLDKDEVVNNARARRGRFLRPGGAGASIGPRINDPPNWYAYEEEGHDTGRRSWSAFSRLQVCQLISRTVHMINLQMKRRIANTSSVGQSGVMRLRFKIQLRGQGASSTSLREGRFVNAYNFEERRWSATQWRMPYASPASGLSPDRQ